MSNSVKIQYWRIPEVFGNVVSIAYGASGDGKSVALRMDMQMMHFWRKKTLKRLKKAWQNIKNVHDLGTKW